MVPRDSPWKSPKIPWRVHSRAREPGTLHSVPTRILFDGNALQSQVHRRAVGPQPAGVRLEEPLAAPKNGLAADVKFSVEGDPLSAAMLEEADVPAIPTRPPNEGLPPGMDLGTAPYTDDEIDRIVDAVERGTGLVLFTNHTGLTQEDDRLAEQFGIEALDFTYYNHPSGDCSLEGDQMVVHPILSGGPEGASVDQIVFENCGLLWKSSSSAAPVVRLPSHEKAFFSVTAQSGIGRVVVIADSGILGSKNPQGRGVRSRDTSTVRTTGPSC